VHLQGHHTPRRTLFRLHSIKLPPITNNSTNHEGTSPSPTVEPDLPIAIRKGIRSTCNPSAHYIALSYHRLSQPFYTHLSSISFVFIPKFVGDALAHPGWRQAMLDEMNALQNNGIWELVPLPSRKFFVGCRWIFAIKVGHDGIINRLKARLVAKDYT